MYPQTERHGRQGGWMVGQAIRTAGLGYIILKTYNILYIYYRIWKAKRTFAYDEEWSPVYVCTIFSRAEIVQNIHKCGKLSVLLKGTQAHTQLA